MRYSWCFILILLVSACQAGNTSQPLKPDRDLGGDIDRFLSTTDPIIENQIIDGLRRTRVSHNTVKEILKNLSREPHGTPGLHLDLQWRRNGKTYPYALYVPESAVPGKTYPMMVVLHGMGGSGANTPKVDRGEGSLGLFLNDPTVYEDVKILLGGARRSAVLRTLIGMAAGN